MEQEFHSLHADDVQVDEVWQYIYCKEKTAQRKEFGPEVGDSWLWVAIERSTKLLLCNAPGQADGRRRQRLHRPTGPYHQGAVQSVERRLWGLPPAPSGDTWPVGWTTGKVVKVYGMESKEDRRKYSPATIIDHRREAVLGKPQLEDICTSHVERSNLNFRTFMRRMTRLALGFSKKWANHEAAVAPLCDALQLRAEAWHAQDDASGRPRADQPEVEHGPN